MRRLSQAGFKKDFVARAVLPEWWDENCIDDPNLLPDIEIRVARFLGLPLSTIRSPTTVLAAPTYPGAQLRRVRDLDRDRLAPAIHAAMRLAEAVVRSMREPPAASAVPTRDGIAWRDELRRVHARVTLECILDDLWRRGIPVVPIEVLPAPSFQGLACIVENRPVILVGHKYDEPGRVAFLIAHETGHIAAGDCVPGKPVVDEDEEVLDDAEIERNADQYATRVLVGDEMVPKVDGATFKELAKGASQIERASGADASAIVFAWAARTGEYAKASMAVRALYRGSGARRQLRQHFDRHVDFDAATETDRALLRCVLGGAERDASAA